MVPELLREQSSYSGPQLPSGKGGVLHCDIYHLTTICVASTHQRVQVQEYQVMRFVHLFSELIGHEHKQAEVDMSLTESSGLI